MSGFNCKGRLEFCQRMAQQEEARKKAAEVRHLYRQLEHLADQVRIHQDAVEALVDHVLENVGEALDAAEEAEEGSHSESVSCSESESEADAKPFHISPVVPARRGLRSKA